MRRWNGRGPHCPADSSTRAATPSARSRIVTGDGPIQGIEVAEATWYRLSAWHPVRWIVQELLSSWELAAEGTAMGHCVVSYSDQCADGNNSVWSIGLQCGVGDTRENVLTVAVDVEQRTVTQARGRHSMLPNQIPRSAQARRAAEGRYLQMLNRSDHILGLWMERERLRREN